MTQPTPATLVVAVAEDLFRDALGEALAAESDLHVAGTAGRSDEAHALVESTSPDLLVTALHLENPRSGIALSRAAQATAPGVRVLVLLDEQEPSDILAALESGAVGTVWRGDDLQDVLRNVRAALRGEACVPRRMLGGVLTELIARRRREDAVHDRYTRLSRREREVLRLLAAGHDNARIARDLVISPQTARTHVQNILEKLEVHSRIEAARLALEHGLADAEGARP
jgi:DNA-binding NarL/FixJ family response regulator